MTDEVNTNPLTPDFLTKVQKKVVFHPQSLDEAEYVVQQLMAQGFRYYKAEYAQQLPNVLQGSLYLDTDKTIMVSGGKAEGLLANADQFSLTTFSSPPGPLVRDVLHGTFAFFPRSVAEGRSMLVILQQAGATLPEGTGGTFPLAARAVYQGMLVKDGRISFAPAAEELQAAKVLTASDIGLGQVATMTAEQSAMNAAFNEMAARMEQMAAQLARLENEILPKTLDKPRAPGLKKP